MYIMIGYCDFIASGCTMQLLNVAHKPICNRENANILMQIKLFPNVMDFNAIMIYCITRL